MINNIIDKVLSLEVFKEQPPILIDIGASGFINKKWKQISKYSICIAFDPDKREMNYIENENKSFKKIYIFHKIASSNDSNQENFHLTKSPYCSSLLSPNHEGLKNWSFSALFDVEKIEKFSSITLTTVLNELNISKIDWFKVDTQGTDLRLFESLKENLFKQVLTAEFEPGILNSYINEDKLYQIMKNLDNYGFWLSEMKIKGSQRILVSNLEKYFHSFTRKYIHKLLKTSPGWAEVKYLNSLENIDRFSKRDLLLLWVFSYMDAQYGFCIDIANEGYNKYKDEIFLLLLNKSIKKINTKILFLPLNYIFSQIKRIYNKINFN